MRRFQKKSSVCRTGHRPNYEMNRGDQRQSKRVAVLAPQPFFVERGTPIAVDLLARTLEQDGHQVTIVTLPVGRTPTYKRVRIERGANPFRIKSAPPGYSLKKLLLELFMVLHFLKIVRREQFQVVHAVEESVFWALLLRPFFRFQVIYDMDSSMAEQLVTKYVWLKPMAQILNWFEDRACRKADAVVAVCDVLVEKANSAGARQVHLLTDIANSGESASPEKKEDIRSLCRQSKIALYVGNLELYQGIDLLYESALALKRRESDICLIIIGGSSQDVASYRIKTKQDGLDNILFLGPRPIEYLEYYLEQADILLSPRITGTNTPMKIFNYMASERPIVATNLKTHTQVLTSERALLVEPDSSAFSNAIERLANNEAVSQRIGLAAREYVLASHSMESYRKRLNRIYASL